MGKRGPAPTPTKILNARGSWRGDLNPNEPTPAAGAPRCPSELSADAKVVWRTMAAELAALGMMTKIDGRALARYCDATVRWRGAAKFLAEKGEFYSLKDEKGAVKCVVQWPQVAIYNSLAVLLLRLEQEFGLTPSSRSRVQSTLPPTPLPRRTAAGGKDDAPPVMKIA